jgi:hypothetical protein
MSQTNPPAGTSPPTAPSRASPSTFATRSDAWLAWCETSFYGWVVSVASNVYDNAVDAFNNAVAGAASAAAALVSQNAAAASAQAAAASAGASIWVSGTTYAIGDVRWSPTTRYTYRRITAGAGTTDPSADATNWALNVTGAPQLVAVSGTTQAAQANVHYALNNVAATTVTLPASPSVGDVVWVTVCNGLGTNVIAGNANKVMSLDEDMTLDNANATACLRYINSTLGWRLV